MIFYCQIYY